MNKRAAALIIALCLCISLLPAGASADSAAPCSTPGDVYESEAGQKISSLTEALNGKYFTVNGKPCCVPSEGGHGCDNCNVENVVTAKWLKDAVTLVPNMSTAGKFRHYYYDETLIKGQSCCGFANFAGWYVFAQTANDVVEFAPAFSGDYNYSTMKNAKAGDVMRLGNDKSSYGSHSALVVSVDAYSGVYVLDSNWGTSGNCKVSAHYISYGQYAYVTVSRAKNYRDGVRVETGLDGTEFPDSVFRGYVFGEFDKNKSGVITDDECDAVTAISCADMGITSLKGIENFKNLTSLDCSGNSISCLDLSKNKKLTSLSADQTVTVSAVLNGFDLAAFIGSDGFAGVKSLSGGTLDKGVISCMGDTVSYTYDTGCAAGSMSVTLCGLAPASVFSDMVARTHWAYSSVNYVVWRGIMSGTSATTFEPDGTVTRAMIAVMLYNLSGEPTVHSENPFTDVPETWFTVPIIWAYENGIVSGNGDGTFSPNSGITREQLAVMTANYAQYIGRDIDVEFDLSGFEDVDAVSPWAVPCIRWACANGIINGSDEDGRLYLMPQGNATRAQIAVIFHNFCETFAI